MTSVRPPPRLLLHERTLPGGSLEHTWLEVEQSVLYLRLDDGDRKEVPLAVLEAVMNRYGKPLADEIVVTGTTLALEGGPSLQLFRHRALYDVIAKDYLVYAAPGREPVAELAAAVTAALSYLLKR
jgi:hypothetical protein